MRRTCAAVVASPSRPQDAFRCNFFELRYPSPLGGIFAAPRLRRGGCESAAAPKTPQDAPRCDFIELSGPRPSWTSKNRSWASRRLQDLAKMGPKLEAKIISFGRPSWHPFGVGVGAPGRRRAFFLDAQVAPPKPPPTKKKNRILVLILYLAAIFFWGGSQWGATCASKKLLCGALELQDPFQMEANLSLQN